jgi:hypothetical protein
MARSKALIEQGAKTSSAGADSVDLNALNRMGDMDPTMPRLVPFTLVPAFPGDSL